MLHNDIAECLLFLPRRGTRDYLGVNIPNKIEPCGRTLTLKPQLALDPCSLCLTGDVPGEPSYKLLTPNLDRNPGD